MAYALRAANEVYREHAGIHRILVDRGLYGDEKAKLTVASCPTILLGYELTRKLQHRMADLDRSALDDGEHVGNVHIDDEHMATVEWFEPEPPDENG